MPFSVPRRPSGSPTGDVCSTTHVTKRSRDQGCKNAFSRTSVRPMSVISPALVSPHQHAAAVDDLVRRYRAVPQGTRVRLGKRTSNLFRFGQQQAERLDTAAFTGVIDVDAAARTAEVQGMTTYETLVDATLARGVMPLVVPQLKTITLGGAVTGLGIESSSFRHGLPHESVRAMDVLTRRRRHRHRPAGQRARRSVPRLPQLLRHAGLRAAPGDRRCSRSARYVHAASTCASTPPTLRRGDRRRLRPGAGGPDFVDGTVFRADDQYLTARPVHRRPRPGGPSDYTGQQVFYRSIQRAHRRTSSPSDDYIWRWDTDWFWCSRAFGVQNPVVRRLWPRRYRRSDVYRRIVALDRRYGLSATGCATLAGRPAEEPVIQDVEIPVDRLAGVPRRLPPRDRHRAGLALPDAAAGERPGRSTRWTRRAVRQRRLLVGRAPAARATRRRTTG